jgi:hypothetical protein
VTPSNFGGGMETSRGDLVQVGEVQEQRRGNRIRGSTYSTQACVASGTGSQESYRFIINAKALQGEYPSRLAPMKAPAQGKSIRNSAQAQAYMGWHPIGRAPVLAPAHGKIRREFSRIL